jgi:anti-sigma factor RsiW
MIFGAPALSCQELVELVSDYFDGKLSRRDRRRFEAHIAGCDACTAYLDQMRTLVRMTGTLSAEAVAPAAMDELLGVFRDWRSED